MQGETAPEVGKTGCPVFIQGFCNKRYQNRGIGSKLVDAVITELKKRGAQTISVTVTEDSAGFWEKKSFKRLPVFLMLRDL